MDKKEEDKQNKIYIENNLNEFMKRLNYNRRWTYTWIEKGEQ